MDQKVKGIAGIVRNSSGAIVNNDDNAFKAARAAKKAALAKQKEFNDMRDRLDGLETLVKELLKGKSDGS